MQDALLRLTEYWAGHGCMLVQPFNTEVGAGTLNPATALRVLGPEPWRVAYVEPSVRPDDSRYGDNPNRLQTHTQFQVILKPEPGDPQGLYLRSLAALGIDINQHDVRFVEDNWASPALGAWGLGWEVWLDGLEITQFTYFQQSGGLALDPPSVEITYGVERIIMALQGVRHFKDIAYAPGISYGEAFGQAEYEMSVYYLDEADVERVAALFETYTAEAQRLIDARLPVPAHSYVLKCSHAFNVLDSRGAISTTERARAFARMRDLAHRVAELWVERRAELGHPLGVAVTEPAVAAPAVDHPTITEPSVFVLEIGVEELPPTEVGRTADAVRAGLTEKLAASRLGHGEIRVVASPRRVVATVDAVEPREADHVQTDRGPRVSAAYDASGAPTKAALGFARSKGVDVDALTRVEENGVEHVSVVRQLTGRPASRVLAELVPSIVQGLRAEKNMRWSAPGLTFARPIRWILALLGEHVVPFSVSTLHAGDVTFLDRAAAAPVLQVTGAAGYVDLLREHGVVADPAERRAAIVTESVALAASVGATIDTAGESALIDEVTNLVEKPTAILGSFDEAYLALPAEVITAVMRKHQRYLPVRAADGALRPHFVAVANGERDQNTVRAGNEAVLRARYEDASFFWRKDLAVPPAELRERLGRLTFAARLGSMGDRVERIRHVALGLAERIGGITPDERATLERAAGLVKFDLGSQMVIELSSLAGVMAREYALRAGETPEVAQALFEAELPRQAGDRLPASLVGGLLSLADRLDLIAGLFAAGSTPKGSSDPLGLRRAALGVVNILLDQPRLGELGLRAGLELAGAQQPITLDPKALAEAHQFIVRRFEQSLLEKGQPTDVVRAVLPLADRPARAARTATDLAGLLDDPQFQQVVVTMQRAARITPPDVAGGADHTRFTEDAERALDDALLAVRSKLPTDATLRDFSAIAGLLVEPTEEFFDKVLVMAEDPAVRANRLGLLAAIRDLGADVLDWAAVGRA